MKEDLESVAVLKARLRVSDGKTGQGGDVCREGRPCSMAEGRASSL